MFFDGSARERRPVSLSGRKKAHSSSQETAAKSAQDRAARVSKDMYLLCLLGGYFVVESICSMFYPLIYIYTSINFLTDFVLRCMLVF